MKQEGDAVCYLINLEEDRVLFEEVLQSDLYTNSRSGFVRKAIVGNQHQPKWSERFSDPSFRHSSSQAKVFTRIYEMYDEEVDIFPQDENDSSYINYQSQYCSIMGQSGVISFGYLRTLIITQKINKAGYYQYFVKREGEYYLEECDDVIPIDRKTWKPFWGFQKKHPWQILLFKIWLKECGNWNNMFQAKPFAVLDAFGLPAYKVFNFRKELRFLKEEKTDMSTKQSNIEKLPLNNPNAIIIAKTIDHQEVRKVGLVPDQAAYRIQQLDVKGEPMYRMFSGLPCKWIGKSTAVSATNLNDRYKQGQIDLERSFILNEKQVLTYFNKFYVVPFDFCDPSMLVLQDCKTLHSRRKEQIWLTFQTRQQRSGLLCISIELPRQSNFVSGTYPDTRFFLTKRKTEQQIHNSHLKPSISQEQIESGNVYVNSTCDKWEYYRIDYMQGYNYNLVTFTNLQPGQYRIFINIEDDLEFKVRFDSQVPITEPRRVNLTPTEGKETFDSTFFSVVEDMGVEAALTKKKPPSQTISLSNTFQELGYGSIVIKTLERSEHIVAMRIFPERLKEAGYDLLPYYYDLYSKEQKDKNFVLISQKGRPEIVVMERSRDARRKSVIGQKFPPEGSVQFFRVFPNSSKVKW